MKTSLSRVEARFVATSARGMVRRRSFLPAMFGSATARVRPYSSAVVRDGPKPKRPPRPEGKGVMRGSSGAGFTPHRYRSGVQSGRSAGSVARMVALAVGALGVVALGVVALVAATVATAARAVAGERLARAKTWTFTVKKKERRDGGFPGWNP